MSQERPQSEYTHEQFQRDLGALVERVRGTGATHFQNFNLEEMQEEDPVDRKMLGKFMAGTLVPSDIGFLRQLAQLYPENTSRKEMLEFYGSQLQKGPEIQANEKEERENLGAFILEMRAKGAEVGFDPYKFDSADMFLYRRFKNREADTIEMLLHDLQERSMDKTIREDQRKFAESLHRELSDDFRR